MVKVRLYIEGGGRADAPAGAKSEAPMLDQNAEAFRRGWQRFFGKAGIPEGMLDIVVGGGRRETFVLFSRRLAENSDREAEKPALLVDSEGPVAPGSTVWQHLTARDKWVQPPAADDDSAYLMVQAMENWFLADLPTLHIFFGPTIDDNGFQDLGPIEGIAKDSALAKLRQATARCRPRYKKGKVSYDLIGEIIPDEVAAACPHAKQLLDALRAL